MRERPRAPEVRELGLLRLARQLQRFGGNRATGTALQSVGIHPKLMIGEPGDPYEVEADRVADQVMRMPASGAGGCQYGGGVAAEAPPMVHDVLRSPGRPLDADTRSNMESRFGQDLGDVRVHTDSYAADSASQVSARAYTVGNHVVFGAGEWKPGSQDGNRLLAHELTHVLQQGGSGAPAVQRAPDPQAAKTGRVVELSAFTEGMIAGMTLPLEAMGTTPRRLVTETFRGFAWEVKSELTGEVGDRIWSRFVELATSPRMMASFVLHYWWGLIKGIFSPITGLFDLVKFVWTMQQLQTQLLTNLWTQRAGLADDAGKMAAQLNSLGTRARDAIRNVMKQPPDQVIKSISGWLDTLREEAAKAAWDGGAAIAKKLMASLDVPLPELGELGGEIIGTVLVNIALFVFTDGIGNAITQIAERLGQLGSWLGKFGKVAQMLGKLAEFIAETLVTVGGWVTRAEQAIAKAAEALLKPIMPFLEELGNLLGSVRSFLRRLLGVAEKEAAPALVAATTKGTGTLVEDVTKPVPPVATFEKPPVPPPKTPVVDVPPAAPPAANDPVAEFLAKGGKIKKLPPGPEPTKPPVQFEDVAGGVEKAPAGTHEMPRQTALVRTSEQAGREGGLLAAQRDGIAIDPWDNPQSHIPEYGRGFDGLGTQGPKKVVLEFKGESSQLAPGQMGDEWVGRKIAELEYLRDPKAQELLDAARNGLLEGRTYRTKIVPYEGLESGLDGPPRVYDGAKVEAAFKQRLAQLLKGKKP